LRTTIVNTECRHRRTAQPDSDRGAQAIAALGRADYDVVLMDCQMPDIDGYEASTRIRADQRRRRVPIVALTASATLEDRHNCLAAGMDDYLSKPVTLAQLAATLTQWVPAATDVQLVS
jgi:two-component system sensor histidine kinase/response regulator